MSKIKIELLIVEKKGMKTRTRAYIYIARSDKEIYMFCFQDVDEPIRIGLLSRGTAYRQILNQKEVCTYVVETHLLMEHNNSNSSFNREYILCLD